MSVAAVFVAAVVATLTGEHILRLTTKPDLSKCENEEDRL